MIQRCWYWRWLPIVTLAWRVTIHRRYYGLSWRWGYWRGAFYPFSRRLPKPTPPPPFP